MCVERRKLAWDSSDERACLFFVVFSGCDGRGGEGGVGRGDLISSSVRQSQDITQQLNRVCIYSRAGRRVAHKMC